MALLVLGIYMRMDVHIGHVMNASYGDKVFVFNIMCYVMIGAGAVVTFIGFLGCCSAFQESSCMLGTVSPEILSENWCLCSS
jgi:Tetraspanin family